MSDMPKQRMKRRYDSSRRQAQAGETRRQILAAAHRLFTTRGYVGTTMEALAGEAGVAVETVYSIFGNKRAILARLVDIAVVGDEEPTPILQRPNPQRTRVEHDQQRQIRLFAHEMREIMARVGPLFGVMRSAAITEPEIAEHLQRILATRRANMRVFVEWVQQNGPLRAGLSTDDAADTVWSLSSAEVHHLLTVDRNWTAEHYEQWLGDTLIAALLPPEAATPGENTPSTRQTP